MKRLAITCVVVIVGVVSARAGSDKEPVAVVGLGAETMLKVWRMD